MQVSLRGRTGYRQFRLIAGLPPAVRTFSRGFMPLLLALSLLNGSNYVFHVVVSRLLGPTQYGALAALLGLLLVLSVPFAVIQTLAAKRTAALRAGGDGHDIRVLAAGALKAMVAIGMAGSAGLALASPILGAFLHVGVGSALLVGPYAMVSLLLAIPLGVLQGQMRFRAFAVATAVGLVARLLLGVAVVRMGGGVPGALFATIAAQVVSLMLAVRLLGLDVVSWRRARMGLGLIRSGFSTALLGLAGFWLLAELDLTLARHFLEPHGAGYYAAAGLLARALLFLSGAVSTVAFPIFTEARERDEDVRRLLRVAVCVTAALVALSFTGLALFRSVAVGLTFGSTFHPAAALLPTLGAAMGLFGILNVLVFFHISAGTRAHLVLFAAVALETALITVFHGSPQVIGLVVLGVVAATTGLLYLAASATCRWSPSLVRSSEPTVAGLAPEGESGLEVSVVIPCYNAGRGLRVVLDGIHQHLEGVASHEIIVVSDGSTDDTVRVAEEFTSEHVRVLHYPSRVGKGQALRVGLAEARGEHVAFIDADGDIDPAALGPFLALMKLYSPDIVLGSKRHPLSDVAYPVTRRVMSWTYHKLTRLLFRVKVSDTQTGLKLIRREVLAAVLPTVLEKRYAFDLEFVVAARRLGYRRVFEAPVQIAYRFTSQVDLRATLGIITDTLAIFYRRYVLNTYRPTDRHPAVRPVHHNGSNGAGTFHFDRTRPLNVTVPVSSNGNGHHPLRILFVNWRDIVNPDAGGAEVFTHEVARRWASQGLLTSGFPGASSGEVVDGVRVLRVGRLRTGSFHLLAQRELARLPGYDVVIDEINTIPTFTPLWRRLPPVVALIHQLAADVWDAEVARPLAKLGRWIEPRLLRLYRDIPVVTVSSSTKEDLLALGFADVSVVPEGLDDPPEIPRVKERTPTLLFVGRLAANKRPHHAVEAFQVVREQLLARAHCLVVPSVREGWGLVVGEANSVGTPAVGYDVPGIRDSIRDGLTGFLAEAGNPAALAARCRTLLSDPGRQAALAAQATEWAENLSWDATADELMSVVRRRASDPAVHQVPTTEPLVSGGQP